ncbi:fungal-specific transcription factor domain-containing protein [Limtongia smithiae]|uniref:fungal-specific transcription factor domain-containing protein n=1 Tax=Limtongia smithiae TaxID=1125753 RepID=UPI0034CF16ED
MELTFVNRTSPSAVQPKRRRIARACELCRERKVRCDGQMPMCAPCATRNPLPETCVYLVRKRRPASSGYVPVITATGMGTITPNTPETATAMAAEAPAMALGTASTRDSEYGRQLPSLSMTSTSSTTPLSSLSSAPSSTASHYASATDDKHVMTASSDADADADADADLYPRDKYHDDNPDAMGAHMSAPVFVRPVSFFGRSSTYMFMEQLKSAVVRTTGGTATPRARPSLVPRDQRTSETTTQLASIDIILPSRKLADLLVSLYFQYTHNLYPFVHKPSFMATYESIWSGQLSLESRPYFYATLNIVFALGGQFSDDIPVLNREKSLSIYFERATKVLRLDYLDMAGDLEMIQALLLMCQYLQGSKRANMCWNLMGLTIRIAQSNGLHVDCDVSACKDWVEFEMRRRVWWGCILLDKVLAMTLGRPSMISDNFAIPAPVSVDDEHISPEGIGRQPPNQPPLSAFFVASVRFFVIIDAILHDLYADRQSDSWEHELKCISDNIQKLSAWRESVPWFLRAFSKTVDVSGLDDRVQRQGRILLSRYLHGRIILLRVTLSHLLRTQADTTNPADSFLVSSSVYCSKLCVDASVALAELTLINEQSHARGPIWWYNLFYAYTAAAVLLMARLVPAVWRDVDAAKVERAWVNIEKTAEVLQTKTSLSGRYLQFLMKMKNRVDAMASEFSRSGSVVGRS